MRPELPTLPALFRNLEPPVDEALARAMARRCLSLRHGQRYHLDAQRQIALVCAGTIGVRRGLDRPLQAAPEGVVGILGRIWDVREQQEIECVSPSADLLVLEDDEFSALLDRSSRLRERLRVRFDEEISSARNPTPYRCESMNFDLFILEASPGQLAALLPHGLQPVDPTHPLFGGLASRCVLSVASFRLRHRLAGETDDGLISYSETSVYVPIRGPGAPLRYYCPDVYTESPLLETVARRLCGLDFKQGRSRPPGETQDVGMEVVRTDRSGNPVHRILSAEWYQEEAVHPAHALVRAQQALLGDRRGARLLASVASLASPLFLAVQAHATRPVRLPPVHVLLSRRSPLDDANYLVGGQVHEIIDLPFQIETIRRAWEKKAPRVVFHGRDHQVCNRCLYGLRLDCDVHLSGARKVWGTSLPGPAWMPDVSK